MQHEIHALARLARVSTRTLRHYDQIGLLTAQRLDNGYRCYGPREVDRLQQILFYRRLGMGLAQIREILDGPDFTPETAMQQHLARLRQEQENLAVLIATVEKTLQSWKGEYQMTDQEKFDGLTAAHRNEARYGAELRSRYGEAAVEAAQKKLCAMKPEELQVQQALEQQIRDLLARAVAEGNPAGETAQAACAAHARWIQGFWPAGMYTRQAHLGLGQMYLADERFTAYYDAIAPGCTQFLVRALGVYCGQSGENGCVR